MGSSQIFFTVKFGAQSPEKKEVLLLFKRALLENTLQACIKCFLYDKDLQKLIFPEIFWTASKTLQLFKFKGTSVVEYRTHCVFKFSVRLGHRH